jgi:tRNA pseudouridine55 synthase
MAFNYDSGEILLVNKPFDWSSTDVVRKIKNIGKINKIGHAGTLDPYATGLLILCTGKSTKIISELQDMPKTYQGTFLLGKTTPSFDLETDIDNEFDISGISEEMIAETALSFEGESEQLPPIYSAVKVDGKRAYKLARKGGLEGEIAVNSKQIKIYYFKIISLELPVIHFEIKCSKGTYIRAIARDFGRKLNSGAHLTSLIRTKIGDYSLENAYSIDNWDVFKPEITT